MIGDAGVFESRLDVGAGRVGHRLPEPIDDAAHVGDAARRGRVREVAGPSPVDAVTDRIADTACGVGPALQHAEPTEGKSVLNDLLAGGAPLTLKPVLKR